MTQKLTEFEKLVKKGKVNEYLESQFIEDIVTLEERRANIEVTQRRIHKELLHTSDLEFMAVQMAEKAGFAEKIPDLRSSASLRLKEVWTSRGIRRY